MRKITFVLLSTLLSVVAFAQTGTTMSSLDAETLSTYVFETDSRTYTWTAASALENIDASGMDDQTKQQFLDQLFSDTKASSQSVASQNRGGCLLTVDCSNIVDMDLDCRADLPSVDFALPIIIDACATVADATLSALTIIPGNTGCPGDVLTITRTYFIQDTVGSMEQCGQIFTVESTNTPTLTPANAVITEMLDANCEFVLPDYTATITLTSDCNAPAIVQSPAAGTIVSSATTTVVTFSVTDFCGRMATTMIDVVTEDMVPPTASCVAALTVQLDDTGMASITAADIDNGSADGCGIASTTIDIDSFSCADIGTPVTVTLTVTDNNMNSSICTTTVTVEDNVDPVFVGSVPTPPVGANYTVDTGLTANYQSITGTGTVLGNGDDTAFTATLGAPFTLYGNTVNSLRVATNGYISISLTDNGPDLSNDCPLPAGPSTGTDTARLYPLHDDTIATIYYQYFGVSPYPHPNGDTMGASVIEWVGTHFSGGAIQHQTILFDNGDVIYQYLLDAEDGSGSTIGAQESGSGLAVTAACNTAGTSVSAGIYGLSPYGGTLSSSPTASMGCPVDMVLDTDPGICGAVVNYGAVTAVDNCGMDTLVQTEGLASGSTFPVGVTTNTFEATDINGNIAICTFTVTVEDTTPIVVVSGPIDIFTGTGASAGDCATTVNYGPITIDSFVLDDNCGDASTTTLVQTGGLGSGAMFPVGVTTEEYTLTDNNGNETVYTFEVTITDTTLPAIDCPGDLIVSDGGTGVYTIEDYAATVTDNCSSGVDLVITQDPVAGTEVAALSTTTVTVTATDAAGNINTCVFDILVDDTLSVDDAVFNEASISMYPNPTNGILNITAGNTTIDKVEVYDLSGRLVKRVSFDTNNYQFNLNDVDASVYLVQIFSGSNTVVKRVVKN